jgi:SAM-dependent methyltransferase
MRAMSTDPGVARPRLGALAAGLLTFLAAGCVLVLEIAAGRLLAPYVGVSLTVWTSIIGVILAGIALGAWAGGRLADRVGADRLLGPTFVVGGLAAMASVPVVGVVGEAGLGTDPAAVVLLAALGFVAPAAILSAIAPMIVRASLVDLASSGSLVGRLSAIGTLGAISGTFATGFVLLGLIPTRFLILGTGGLLVAIGLALVLARRGDMATVLLGVGAAAAIGGAAATVEDPCQRESAYFCMTVVPSPGDPDGRTLVLDRVRHAYVDLADPRELGFRYVRWFADASADVVASRGGDIDVVHVGGGGFTFPRYLAAVAPASRHVVLELDPEVLAVARYELGFAESPRIDVRLGDARLGIRSIPTDSADLVVGDAFGGLSVPWHLTTVEFLAEIDRVLRPGGRYVMNLIDGPELRFARAEATTFRAVWPQAAVIAPRAALIGAGGSNIVLVGSSRAIDGEGLVARLRARGDAQTEVITAPDELDAFTGDAPVLTDDFAPVDQLLIR